MAPSAAINLQRLRKLLQEVNLHGFNPQTGGHNRPGYSDADMAARRWFAEQMRGDGLAVRSDAVANLFGRYGRDRGPCIMAGSHLDTVPEGGAFDGALGACVALECVRTMRDIGFVPSAAIEVVATAEEEGRFGGMLGSQAIAGAVTERWLESARDADGIRLQDAMREQGLDAFGAIEAARAPGSVRAFLELHVEQGPVLEQAQIPVGIVEHIAGVINLAVTLTGRANHSGTTPMELRADAFAGLARVGQEIGKVIAAHGSKSSRITIGKVDLHPNFIHTVPGRAEFIINIRDTDAQTMRALAKGMTRAVEDAAKESGLTWEVVQQSLMEPIRLDADIARLLEEEAARLSLPALRMPSGAGHDAQTMQSLCPSGLIFVPSRDGISHAPQEWTDWDAIEKGANLMLRALMRLSG
ncbi:MAG: Zn-dependent hydrolase [Nitratireductor sp.]|nr:Zn-dependent hydrolase [Nitratireductor sp.]